MKKVIVTTSWDDGHILDLKLVKLLNKYGLAGTLYVSPMDREIEKSKLLTAKQIKSVMSKNIEIGAHTMTHPRVNAVTPIEANKEIVESKAYLTKLTGKKVISFCYPGGEYDPINVSQVKKAGYKMARTTKTFELSAGSNPFEIPTSVHAYDHYTDVFRILTLVKFNPIKFMKLYLHWDNIAKELFDRALKDGGVFHLWGHSWEIDNHKDWERLENVFKHISKREGVKYVTNGEL